MLITTILLLIILAQTALTIYLLDALTSLRLRIRRHLTHLTRWRNRAQKLPSNARLIAELRAGRMQQRASHARLQRILRARRNGGRCQGGDT